MNKMNEQAYIIESFHLSREYIALEFLKQQKNLIHLDMDRQSQIICDALSLADLFIEISTGCDE